MLPGEFSKFGLYIVCIESITKNLGLTFFTTSYIKFRSVCAYT